MNIYIFKKFKTGACFTIVTVCLVGISREEGNLSLGAYMRELNYFNITNLLKFRWVDNWKFLKKYLKTIILELTTAKLYEKVHQKKK